MRRKPRETFRVELLPTIVQMYKYFLVVFAAQALVSLSGAMDGAKHSYSKYRKLRRSVLNEVPSREL